MARTRRLPLGLLMAFALALGIAPAVAFAQADSTLAAGTALTQQADITYIDNVTIELTPPKAGESGDSTVVNVANGQKSSTSAVVSVPANSGYSVEAFAFCAADENDLAKPVTFEVGKTYYMWVTLNADNGKNFRSSIKTASTKYCLLARPITADDIYSYNGGEQTYSALHAFVSFQPYAAQSSSSTTTSKAANTLATKSVKKAFAYKTLKKKAQVFTPKVIKTKGQGTITYAKKSVTKKFKKFISVTKKGKVTVKRGAPKGKCKLVLNVKAAGNADYASVTKSATVTINVK